MAGNSIRQTPAGRVLVTGASGFIGRATAEALERAGHLVVRGARVVPAGTAANPAWVAYGDIGAATRWEPAVASIDAVVHVAGLAHLPDDTTPGAAEAFHEINALGTAGLAAAAIAAGVRRFVLISSALVHGPGRAGRAFTEADTPAPATPYARSKLEAEEALRQAAAASAMSFAILRPPLVYGPGVRANFRRLMRLAASGLPIPLGAATAPRRVIAIDNLTSAIERCLSHPGAQNETFLVCDAETTSTADLIRHLAAAQGRRAWLPAVPPGLLRPAFTALGRSRDFDRLFAPLDLDARKIRESLSWTPPIALAEGIRRAVATR